MTQSVVLVSGVSGAGKSSALKAFEDLGYEAIDNVPMTLLGRLVAPGDFPNPIAAGIDIRTRDFGPGAFLNQVAELKERSDLDVRVLFMDCADEVLQRRFAETRRRHPLAIDRPVSDGIARERNLMAQVREIADVVVDTTELSLGDMKRQLEDQFSTDTAPGLSLHVMSFSFKVGVPSDADLVFDVRFLKNPHYVADLKPLTGRDAPVADYIQQDSGFADFFANLTRLLDPLLPRYESEGKSYLTVAVGCTGGQHRSVFCAEQLNQHLMDQGRRVHLRHRDLDKALK